MLDGANFKEQIKKMSKKILILFETFIYFYYKIDILFLHYITKHVFYLFFLFTLFFGCFGSSEYLSLEMSAFKYFCFLFTWYTFTTSLFVFLSFQIPFLKKYLYKLLGEAWVKDKIGNPGKEQVIKIVLGTSVAFVGNEASKFVEANQNLKASKQIVENLRDLYEHTGINPTHKEIQETLRKSTEVASRPAKGFFDRVEDRAATAHLVENVGQAWNDWWSSGPKKK